jgi:DNA repair ATPase RecN
MDQTEIVNHNPLSSHQDMFRAFGVSAAPDSSYTMNAGTPSSLSAESCHESGVQIDYANATSFTPGQVEGAALDLVAIQGQIATTQEASSERERKILEKKERDKARKRTERHKDAQDYARICELLEISLTPRSSLAHRSECLYFHICPRY